MWLWMWTVVLIPAVISQAEQATTLNETSAELNTTEPPAEPWLVRFRMRVENNSVRYADDFVYEDLCDHGIAMYSRLRGYWQCTKEKDCPSFYNCSHRINETGGYCCPLPTLCERGIPVSNRDGIMTCKTDYHCPVRVQCIKNEEDIDSIGVCCATKPCRKEDDIPLISELNPYPVLASCHNKIECNRKGYDCLRERFYVNGSCCPTDYDRDGFESSRYIETLKQLNKERIRRRKEKSRDITYLIPLFGTPFMLVLAACGYQLKNEHERYQRNKQVDEWINARKRRARKMPSVDLTKSMFKYKGVLKLHGEVGSIKHALEAESSRSLRSIRLDPALNELVVIGSAVENVDDIAETSEISKKENVKSKKNTSTSSESVVNKSKEAVAAKMSKTQISKSQEKVSKSAELSSATKPISQARRPSIVALRPPPQSAEPKLSTPDPVPSLEGSQPQSQSAKSSPTLKTELEDSQPQSQSAKSSPTLKTEESSVEQSLTTKGSRSSPSQVKSSEQVDSFDTRSNRTFEASESFSGPRKTKLSSLKRAIIPIIKGHRPGNFVEATQRSAHSLEETRSKTGIHDIFGSDASDEPEILFGQQQDARRSSTIGPRSVFKPSSSTPVTARSPSSPDRTLDAKTLPSGRPKPSLRPSSLTPVRGTARSPAYSGAQGARLSPTTSATAVPRPSSMTPRSRTARTPSFSAQGARTSPTSSHTAVVRPSSLTPPSRTARAPSLSLSTQGAKLAPTSGFTAASKPPSLTPQGRVFRPSSYSGAQGARPSSTNSFAAATRPSMTPRSRTARSPSSAAPGARPSLTGGSAAAPRPLSLTPVLKTTRSSSFSGAQGARPSPISGPARRPTSGTPTGKAAHLPVYSDGAHGVKPSPTSGRGPSSKPSSH